MAKNGFYKAQIIVGKKCEEVVLVLKDGQVFGGDNGFFYSGRYSDAGGAFKSDVVVAKHNRDARTVLSSAGDKFSISFSGDIHYDAFAMTGTHKESGQMVSITGVLSNDIELSN